VTPWKDAYHPDDYGGPLPPRGPRWRVVRECLLVALAALFVGLVIWFSTRGGGRG
jgi:hypothetical protein